MVSVVQEEQRKSPANRKQTWFVGTAFKLMSGSLPFFSPPSTREKGSDDAAGVQPHPAVDKQLHSPSVCVKPIITSITVV